MILMGAVAFVLFAANANAQTAATPAPAVATTAAPPEFFVGKWDILFKGLPNGDTHIVFTITNQDGKLGGSYIDQDKKEVPLNKVEKDDKGVVLYFTAQGYDVNVNLEKKDDNDHVKANMMQMFDGTGERVKQ